MAVVAAQVAGYPDVSSRRAPSNADFSATYASRAVAAYGYDRNWVNLRKQFSRRKKERLWSFTA
jgi:hypothetical protein